MNEDFLAKVRTGIQATLKTGQLQAKQQFNQVIVRPPEPTPQEVWQEFIEKPAQAHQEEAMAIGREAFLQKAEDMLTLGEQLIGPRARDLMPYLEQFVPPPAIAEPSIPGYSPLIDQALAEVESYGGFGADEQVQP